MDLLQTDTTGSETARVALLHGAGYVGGELVRLLAGHPQVRLAAVTSRTFAGQPVAAAHPALRGRVDAAFVSPDAFSPSSADAVVVAAEHGQGMKVVPALREEGFDGPIVDLSADFRFQEAGVYPEWFDGEHRAPELLDRAVYGLPELGEGPAPDAQLVANPGCFATGMALALAPLAAVGQPLTAHVTALTGASGSGATPSAATHYPDRDGNVRPYKVLAHQHVPEVNQAVGPHVDIQFVPASGPWTRGIWGTIQVQGLDRSPEESAGRFETAYGDAPFVRLTAGELPSLQPVVRTPFCDLGWTHKNGTLVVGFALDNLLKGAASQAVQNLNRVLSLPETAGLLNPHPAPAACLEEGGLRIEDRGL